MKRLSVIVLIFISVAACSFSDQCLAQPKSAGGQFSFNGIELSYQHSVGDSVFVDINAGVDFSELLGGKASAPGGKARISYNFLFFRRDCESGSLLLYAGPGIALGYVRNKGNFGPMLGICGRFGLEFRFESRPVVFSLDLIPLLPIHMRSSGRASSLDFFRNGLLLSLSPVLGIRYRF